MATTNPYPQRHWTRGRQRPPRAAAPGAVSRSRTGRQASLLALACTIPFTMLVLVWQHAQIMELLEGGGEYAALHYGEEEGEGASEDTRLGGGWGEGVRQAADVVRFVAYGTGLLSDADDDDGIDDDEIDNSADSEIVEDSADVEDLVEDLESGEWFPESELAGSIVPCDLSVNHLRLIEDVPGRSLESQDPAREDFLPVATPSDIHLRWRHGPRVGSPAEDAARVTAHRIVARRLGCDVVLWDSRKVAVKGELLFSSPWPATIPPEPGEIIEWRVVLWDAVGAAHTSSWSKFAVGPAEEGGWKGQWIVHPDDMETFRRKKGRGDVCDLWKTRRPLPLFRARLSHEALRPFMEDEEEPLASALLVVSGLGSFRASLDGVALSASGPIDPPFTDYGRRISYRGFDVTDFLRGRDPQEHVIGITMGSGWWDHRPISGMAKPELLPRGPSTVISQLYLTTSKGTVHVVIPTRGGEGAAESTWQVARGHIRESDLFTGEIVDLDVMSDIDGWDTPKAKGTGSEAERWVGAVAYHTDTTHEEWRQRIALKAKAMDPSEAKVFPTRTIFANPIGRLVPSEIPPVLPMERIAPEEVRSLGSGRWLFDFGKAMSGVLHFNEGLPTPIIPETYPRAHGFKAAFEHGDSFVTIIYGDSLEMTTGDINRVLVAGQGLHNGGPRHVSRGKGEAERAYCFPDDHDDTLSQRDVFVVPKRVGDSNEGLDEMFSRVRQSLFTTHGFRFAEVCCTPVPPAGVHALLYRTAFAEWGSFGSSNVLLNGGYELVRNAMASNMLSVQSDCPHRERLPYGGDLVADSPAAMHMYDMAAFYKKTVRDWVDAQWDNGAYTETSVWQDLNDYAGVGHGAGETVWATAPPVLTVRHMQHYGDLDFLYETLPNHARWLEFLIKHFDQGMRDKGYHEDLGEYRGDGSGLGDWLALRGRDTWLTHTAFYMAAARCVAYIANKLGEDETRRKGLELAGSIRKRIATLYLKNGRDNFDYPRGDASATPGPEMGLFSKIVPGEKRCAVLRNWFKRAGSTWPGDEEKLFLQELDESYKERMVRSGELTKILGEYHMGWSQWQGFNEGIFAIRYALKTLSDTGFHNIALRKAAGFGFGTPEYMMSHNATTMWESWWRSEDLYSRNHPMLGAIAEWMSSSAAGVSLLPTTIGGRHALFWPRFPKSAAMIGHAHAEQGTPTGDYAVAWRFEDLPDDKSKYDSAAVRIRIRLLVPPAGVGTLRLPQPASRGTRYSIGESALFPDLSAARGDAAARCGRRRWRRLGFPYSWEYDRELKQWHRREGGKSIGTPCESFLFGLLPLTAQWGGRIDMTRDVFAGRDRILSAGLYEVVIDDWLLEPEVEGTGRLGNIPEHFDPRYDVGPYCGDNSTFEWKVDDASHII